MTGGRFPWSAEYRGGFQHTRPWLKGEEVQADVAVVDERNGRVNRVALQEGDEEGEVICLRQGVLQVLLNPRCRQRHGQPSNAEAGRLECEAIATDGGPPAEAARRGMAL